MRVLELFLQSLCKIPEVQISQFYIIILATPLNIMMAECGFDRNILKDY